VKIMFLAECAGIVRYQVSQSTRLGPSNEVANVTILDTAYASGKEAHDSLTVRNSLNILLTDLLTYSVALVRKRTISAERPPLVGEVIANFLRIEGTTWSA
jgi:hypothetical protein